MKKEFLANYVDALLKDVETYDELNNCLTNIHIYIMSLIDYDYFDEAVYVRNYWDEKFYIKLDEVHF